MTRIGLFLALLFFKDAEFLQAFPSLSRLFEFALTFAVLPVFIQDLKEVL